MLSVPSQIDSMLPCASSEMTSNMVTPRKEKEVVPVVQQHFAVEITIN